MVISTGRDTRHPGVETRDATQHPAVPRTPCHPARVSLVPGLGGPCSGLRLLPGESPGSPDCATLGRAGSGVGGKRLPEPRGWVDWARWAPLGRDPHLFSSCFSPAPGTESQPENSWGQSWGHYWDCSQCAWRTVGFYEKKRSGGLFRQGYSYFPHKHHIHYELVTEPPQEGRGFEPCGGGSGSALPLGPPGRVSEKAASWDDRRRMKSRRAGSCDARECLGIVQPVRTEIITLWNHLYTHFSSFLLETNMKHPSTFLLFHSESSSNIYRASLFRV